MAVTSSGTATVTLPADEEILITREFDAPRHLVYKAWTTPELVKRWWSGHQGETTLVEIDLRVGGRCQGQGRGAACAPPCAPAPRRLPGGEAAATGR